MDACKIHGEIGGSQNAGYDDESGSYNKVSQEDIISFRCYKTKNIYSVDFKQKIMIRIWWLNKNNKYYLSLLKIRMVLTMPPLQLIIKKI